MFLYIENIIMLKTLEATDLKQKQNTIFTFSFVRDQRHGKDCAGDGYGETGSFICYWVEF